MRDRRSIYYDQISEFFSTSESRSGLHSAALKEWTQQATGSYEPSHLIYNLSLVTHHRCMRNTLTKLSKQSLFVLASHFKEFSHSETQSGKYALDLVAKLNIVTPWSRETVNLTNLVVAKNRNAHAHSKDLNSMRDDARFSLEVALSEYASIAPLAEREWKQERKDYERGSKNFRRPEHTKLDFTPPVSWNQQCTICKHHWSSQSRDCPECFKRANPRKEKQS